MFPLQKKSLEWHAKSSNILMMFSKDSFFLMDLEKLKFSIEKHTSNVQGKKQLLPDQPSDQKVYTSQKRIAIQRVGVRLDKNKLMVIIFVFVRRTIITCALLW